MSNRIISALSIRCLVDSPTTYSSSISLSSLTNYADKGNPPSFKVDTIDPNNTTQEPFPKASSRWFYCRFFNDIGFILSSATHLSKHIFDILFRPYFVIFFSHSFSYAFKKCLDCTKNNYRIHTNIIMSYYLVLIDKNKLQDKWMNKNLLKRYPAIG